MNRILKYRVYLMVFIIGFFLVKPGIGVGEAPEAGFLLEWGEKGPGSGEFNQPIGIAVDNEEYVYISDTGNNRIQKFSKDGKFISSWGKEGAKVGEFNIPMHISLDSKNNLFITEYGNDVLLPFYRVRFKLEL